MIPTRAVGRGTLAASPNSGQTFCVLMLIISSVVSRTHFEPRLV